MTVVNETGSGGLVASGSSRATVRVNWSCPCNSYTETGDGGATVGGEAEVSVWQPSGGATVGGSATVDVIGRTWDGLVSVYPLIEDGPPYAELVRGLNGTSTNPPAQDDGVFCLNSQLFSNYKLISLPADGLPADHDLTVSVWFKLNSILSQRIFYSRGFLRLGKSYLNHLYAELFFETDEERDFVDLFSLPLEEDRWYLASVTWDRENLKLYVNGELVATESASVVPLAVSAPELGSWNSSWTDLNLQDLRVSPEVLSAAYLRAIYSNYCDPEFVWCGPEEESGVWVS